MNIMLSIFLYNKIHSKSKTNLKKNRKGSGTWIKEIKPTCVAQKNRSSMFKLAKIDLYV
jgi:hypothetical protein